MRLPLATTLKNRSSSRARDARLLNAVVDSRQRVQKRPSLVQVFTEIDAGAGLGLFVRNTPFAPDDASDGGGGGGSGSGKVSQELIVINNNNSGTDGTLTTSPTTFGNFLSFSQQPSDWKILTNMSPAVTVRVQDAFGTLDTSFNGPVTLSLLGSDTFPKNSTLSGITEVNAVNGVATFSNLVIDRVGANYQFQANSVVIFGSGDTCVSKPFSIKSYLRFTVQPSSARPSTTISPAVQVSVVDSAGSAISSYTGNGYNIDIDFPDWLTTGVISGDKIQQTSTGVAEFDNLQINNEGTYLLQAEADVIAIGDLGLARVYSDSFEISTFTHTLIAAEIIPGAYGMEDGIAGSISPTTFSGGTILVLEGNAFDEPNYTLFRVNGTHAQNSFTSITANSITLLSADATYSQAGGFSQWQWFGTVMFTAATTYLVNIV